MRLRIEPTIKQHECYQALSNPKVEEVFFGGGAGGGKSWAICESRLINAVRYPGYKSFIGRNELKRLMQSTFITWNKVCKKHSVSKSQWRLDGKYNYIEFINPSTGTFDGQGSRIDLLDLKFMPSEDPLFERFGSLEYSDGAIEEAGEVHPLAREVLKSRVNRHMNDELGINPSLLYTGNPKKNWTYRIFYKPYSEGKLPENQRFIQALYKDNPYTAESYGKTLSNIKDRVMKERLKDGNWEYADDVSALMTFEAINDIFTNTIELEDEYGIPYDLPKFATIDVARFGGDKIVITLWKGWYAYKILYREKQGLETTKLWVKGIIEKEGIPRSRVIADEDGVGGYLIDSLVGIKGFIANSSPIEIDVDDPEENDLTEEELDTRRKKTPKQSYSNLKTQCAYKLAERVNKREVAVFTEDEQVKSWLIADLEQIKEVNTDSDDRKKKLVPKDQVKDTLGRSPDFGDTFIMRAYFDLKKSGPVKKHVPTQTRPDWISQQRR